MAIKLLFADDSVTMQKVIQLTLENEDIDIIFAGDGNRAWELARDRRPDIVVADVFMPGLDGLQLCEKLKQNPETAAIPVILISGELESYDAAKGEEAGAAAHITKPFKSGEFIDAVKKYSAVKKGPASSKASSAKAAKAPRPQEGDEKPPASAPAVLELLTRVPSGKTAEVDDELEIVDEDIDSLEDDLEGLEGEEGADDEEEFGLLEDEGGEAVAAEAGQPEDDRSGEEIEAVSFALREPEEKSDGGFDDIRLGDDFGEVVAEAGGEFMPPASAATPPAEPAPKDSALAVAPRPVADIDDALEALGISDAPPAEEALGGTGEIVRAIEEEAAQLAAEKEDPSGGEDELWGKTMDEIDKVLLETVETVGESGGSGGKVALDDGNGAWEVMDAPTGPPPAKTDAPPPVIPDQERMDAMFRKAAGAAFDRFLAANAADILREELARAVEVRVKEAFEQQFEKAIREEIGRVMAAGFQNAMPRMLAIIDKITVQVTPRIAQQMIKIAIERIKKGDIN